LVGRIQKKTGFLPAFAESHGLNPWHLHILACIFDSITRILEEKPFKPDVNILPVSALYPISP
jgi:hypothetical protein